MAQHALTHKQAETAILIGVSLKSQRDEIILEYLDELSFLAETAGAVVQKHFYQKLDHPDAGTYVRKGKLEEIKEYVMANKIDRKSVV